MGIQIKLHLIDADFAREKMLQNMGLGHEKQLKWIKYIILKIRHGTYNTTITTLKIKMKI